MTFKEYINEEKLPNKSGYFSYTKKELDFFENEYKNGKTLQIKFIFSHFVHSVTPFYWKDITGKPMLQKKSLHEYRVKPKDDKNGSRDSEDVRKNGLK